MIDLGIAWLRDLDFGNATYVRFRCGCAAMVGFSHARPWTVIYQTPYRYEWFHSPVDLIFSPDCTVRHEPRLEIALQRRTPCENSP